MLKPPRQGWPIRVQTMAGDPVTANGVTVTPVTRALVVRMPFFALVWNRPIALRVEHGGRVDKMRIVDVTRVVQVGLLVSSAVGIVAAAMLAWRRSEEP